MFAKLFLLFAILPIVEIAVLVNVGEVIGGWYTVALVIFTAFVGAWLVREQGISTLTQAQRKMQQGEMPGKEMAEGVLLLIAGVLLVTPGFITDGIGFLFSLPFTRPIFARALLKHVSVRVMNPGQANAGGTFYYQQSYQQTRRQQEDGDIIEGEFESRPPDQDKLDKP